MKIIFFGTPEFAAYSLGAILESGYDVAAVVTMPDKPAGRGHKMFHSAVKKLAVEKGLPLLQPRNLKDPGFIKELQSYGADLFVVIAFRMLPEIVWAMPPEGTFNLHASLLPAYRGAAPINRAIMNGETMTGVTTFFLTGEIDTGNIIDRREEPIYPYDDAGTLHDRLMVLGADMTVATLGKIQDGTVTSRPQPAGEYRAAPKIFKEDCRIKWQMDDKSVYNQIRGLSPYPGAVTTMMLDRKGVIEVKIYKAEVAADHSRLPAGEISVEKSGLYIGTGGAPLRLLTLQPAGKKPMDADAFLRGYTPLQTVEVP